ncbi:hypothetical protein [Streptomyces canus]|uniref:hypothetical protein n=1 Tax=Streptomyces canus TaxID=58343 RepID=UPI002E3612BA|nr:hypothetical protein [Streptomyces canus]
MARNSGRRLQRQQLPPLGLGVLLTRTVRIGLRCIQHHPTLLAAFLAYTGLKILPA